MNPTLTTEPEIVNKSPEDAGWLFIITDYNEEELYTLMDKETYNKFLETEE